MRVSVDYKKEIIYLSQNLPKEKLRELIDFAHFLKTRKDGFTYMKVQDSAGYVRNLRDSEAKGYKSGKKFIKDLMEWQRSSF